MVLTASDVASMTRCEHRVYLDRFGNPDAKVPYPKFVQILWESGRLHEEEVIADLTYVTPAGDDLDVRFESSIAAMAAGEPLIYHAFLKAGGLTGEPDLLKRFARDTVRRQRWTGSPAVSSISTTSSATTLFFRHKERA